MYDGSSQRGPIAPDDGLETGFSGGSENCNSIIVAAFLPALRRDSATTTTSATSPTSTPHPHQSAQIRTAAHRLHGRTNQTGARQIRVRVRPSPLVPFSGHIDTPTVPLCPITCADVVLPTRSPQKLAHPSLSLLMPGHQLAFETILVSSTAATRSSSRLFSKVPARCRRHQMCVTVVLTSRTSFYRIPKCCDGGKEAIMGERGTIERPDNDFICTRPVTQALR